MLDYFWKKTEDKSIMKNKGHNLELITLLLIWNLVLHVFKEYRKFPLR